MKMEGERNRGQEEEDREMRGRETRVKFLMSHISLSHKGAQNFSRVRDILCPSCCGYSSVIHLDLAARARTDGTREYKGPGMEY